MDGEPESPPGDLDLLLGARVRRVDAPARDLFALTIAARVDGGVAEEALLIAIGDRVRGVGLVDERPKGLAASAFVQQLRRWVGGARIDALDAPGDGTLVLRFGRGEAGAVAIVVELTGASAPNLVLVDADGTIAGAARPGRLRARSLDVGAIYVATGTSPMGWPATLDAMRRGGEALERSHAAEEIASRQRALERAVARAIGRAERKIAAIAGDASRARDADALRREASLLLANLARIDARASEATVIDYGVDPPAEIVLRIDPALGPKEQAERLFRRARKLESGARIAVERRSETERELALLGALRARVAGAEDMAALEALGREAARLRVRGAREAILGTPRRAPRAETARKPFRRFAGAGERPILVGRSAADNDALTLHHARPHDLWLHARGVAGAHVVVPLDKREACPPELLVDAATLAAHFSEARDEPIVDIVRADRRFVRKPKGATPGTVVIDREKVMALRMEPARLARLLASEIED